MSSPVRVARISAQGRFATALITDAGACPLGPWQLGDPMAVPLILPGPDELAGERGALVPTGSFDYLPPISAATKVICLGLNYKDHAEETGEAPPENPALFIKIPDALTGHDQPILRPRVSTAFDFEGEIAVVIGRGGRHIPKDAAMRHVFGFTALMDGSVRDYQQHSASAGKCFYHSGAIGPWIVPLDAIGDVDAMTLRTHLNGEQVQATEVRHMIYDIPTAIAYVSRWTPLAPGDIISTGTPAGVGAMRKPPLWMKAGDVIEVDISGVGTLRNTVADEQ